MIYVHSTAMRPKNASRSPGQRRESIGAAVAFLWFWRRDTSVKTCLLTFLLTGVSIIYSTPWTDSVTVERRITRRRRVARNRSEVQVRPTPTSSFQQWLSTRTSVRWTHWC